VFVILLLLLVVPVLEIAVFVQVAGAFGDGFWLFLAGVLLIIPGFVTDFAGLLLLLPPVRGLAKRGFGRRFGQGSGTAVIRVEGTRVDGWPDGSGTGAPGDWIDAAGMEHRDDTGRDDHGEPPELLP
jgi:UPF0716 family protein affecting phage T7 exclusion